MCRYVIGLVRIAGGGQNLQRRNVEGPIFRNFKIANIEISKVIR